VLELDREIGTDEFLLEEDAAIDADSLAPLSDEAPAAETPAATPIGKIEPVQVLAPKPPAVVQSPEPTAGEALDAGEPTSDPEQLLAEATVYLRYGKHDRAVGALREILASDPEHRAALEHLGEALMAQGDTANAVTAWQRAAEAARGAGDVEDFERLRAQLAEIDAGAAEALAGPAPTPDELDVDLDFDLDAEPVPADDADVDAGAEAGDGSEAPALEAAEIEFSDEFDGLEQVSDEIAPPAEEPVPAAQVEQAAAPARPEELDELDALDEPPSTRRATSTSGFSSLLRVTRRRCFASGRSMRAPAVWPPSWARPRKLRFRTRSNPRSTWTWTSTSRPRRPRRASSPKSCRTRSPKSRRARR
jgi:tetratricopeptide (TPR) repeat protein